MIRVQAGWQQRVLDLLQWLTQFRYIKFGLVGASGTVVNLVVLFLAHRFLFGDIEPPGTPYASLALAIAVATVNNFTWNRLWTWADRVRDMQPPQSVQTAAGSASGGRAPFLVMQFGRYAVASWFGIALQYGLTLFLARLLQLDQPVQVMMVNIFAILVASVSNFLANDLWTFRRLRPP